MDSLKSSLGPGVLAGLVAALLGAAIPTFMDWRLNPSGLFRNADRTDWGVVLESFWTWLWPLALGLIPLCVILVFLWRYPGRRTDIN